MSRDAGGSLGAARDRIRSGLEPVARAMADDGMPIPGWTGKLIRPLVGYAGGRAPDPRSGDPIWLALAAVQLAHEASLVHDDLIDGADERRGVPTLAAAMGVATAVVEGDHLLTSAYRLAARAGSLEWAELFARAVERTVAGEKAQAKNAGRVLEWEQYETVVLGKSGELLGAALAAGPMLRNEWAAERWYETGRRVGLVYQMLDDLLDYCPHAGTGKPALIDYRRGLWTWPRVYVDLPADLEPGQVVARLRIQDDEGRTPLERALERYRAESAAVAAEVAALMPDDTLIADLLAAWLARAEDAVARIHPPEELPPVVGWEGLMAHHAKSFRFASRLFPAEHREQVVGVYAWCRYTDDLVDEADLPPDRAEARLNTWLDISRRAYQGQVTGNELADRVMTEMREADVPFGYAEELVEGMRMDLRGQEYHTLTELWTYTYRVASVVGLWMTELFGIRDPWMLDRAASLGHAMQLTNILRDVGEDLEAGRLYLPTSWLTAHGLGREDLERMAETGDIDPRYGELVERLMRVAEAEYDHAAPAVHRLPTFYRRPVAVAADVYRGIHDAIRANGYDNLRERAYTTLMDKVKLGTGALLRRAEGEGPALQSTLAKAAVFALTAALLLATAGQLSSQGLLDIAGSVEPVEAVDPVEDAFDRIGALWVLGVEEESAVEVGMEAVSRMQGRLQPPSPGQDRLLLAYEGAFRTLRAKHGGWPGARMRNLNEGNALMDEAVARAPDDAAVRYIRLMSGFYLPGIFGRGDVVDDDLEAMVRLLPDAAHRFPPLVLPEIVSFLLENGDPDADQRAALESLVP